MKKLTHFKRIFAVMLCIMMMLGIMQTSVFAAKEMFTTNEISSVAITGINPPKEGEFFDFTADVSSSKYEVVSVAYIQQYGQSYITKTSSTPTEGIIYGVNIILKAADGYYFKTTSQKTSAVASATINGVSANASNNVNTDLYTPKASESADVYRKYLTVAYQFPATPAADPIESFNVNVKKPEVGGYPATKVTIDTVNGKENNGYINVDDMEWTLQNGDPMGDKFEFGETYILSVTLTALYGRNFVVDPTNILSTKENPMPKVNVTVNGASASAFPTYDGKSPTETIEVRYVFRLTEAKKISEIEIDGFSAPKTGSFPSYVAIMPVGVDLADTDSGTSKNGITWIEAGSSAVPTFGYTFAANTVYIVKLELEAEKGYEFDDPTVKIDGKTAEVKSSKTEAIVTYTFPKTGNAVLEKVEIGGVDAPEAGRSPDYTVSYGANCGAADYNDKTTKNGISWYNETDKKVMSTTDKFEEGKTYSVQVMIWTNDGYEFRYKSGQADVAASVNGQSAEVSSRDKEEVTVSYTFPKIAEHKHSPLKVDEYKATCREEGRKAYYFCPECGKNFEDSKCTKEIPDINAWGKIAKLEHTGGKATCDNRAVCKNCGEWYGELAAHQFGTAWDYKDASGHAHKCKVCGVSDTIVPHSGGTAACGEVARCAVCKAEYGEVMQHKWSAGWDYTDAKGHAHKCTICGEHDTVQAHAGGTADCTSKAKCTACGTEYGKAGDHKWGTAWEYASAAGHAHICTICGDHDAVVKHSPGAEATETSEQLCTACSYVIEPAKQHVHKMIRMDAVDASCTTAGKKQYYYCAACSLISSDSKGAKVITDEDSLIVPATGHKESKWKSDENNHWKECTVKGCGAVIPDTKYSHDFGGDDRCDTCAYKRAAVTGAAVTPNPAETGSDPADTGNQAAAPGIVSGTNTAMLIAVIVSGVIAVVCVIIVIVVIAKKKK